MGVVCGKNEKAIKQDQGQKSIFQSQNTLITFGCQKNLQTQNQIRTSIKQQNDERLSPLINAPEIVSNQMNDNESKQITRCKIDTITNIHNKLQNITDSQKDAKDTKDTKDTKDIQNQISQERIIQQPTQIQNTSQTRVVQFDKPEQQNSRTYYIIRQPMPQH